MGAGRVALDENRLTEDFAKSPNRPFLLVFLFATSRRTLFAVPEPWPARGAECATIISRRSPRKSSRQTGTTPPRERISLMGKNRRDWQPISDLTGVTKCLACT